MELTTGFAAITVLPAGTVGREKFSLFSSSRCHFRDIAAARARLVAMHPQLTLDNNQMCVDQILAFQRCHEEVGLWGKLTARCNTEKSLLDRRARPCR